jgi:hypothetical protein
MIPVPLGHRVPRCRCGAVATRFDGAGRRAPPYCPDHPPPAVLHFQRLALAALRRGAERREQRKAKR